jgi:hypothetical protein
MAEQAVQNLIAEVEALALPFYRLRNTQALLVVPETSGHHGIQSPFPGVPERRMAEVMPEAYRLRQVFIQTCSARDRARDPGYFPGVRHARPVMVTLGLKEHLGLMHQPSESL